MCLGGTTDDVTLTCETVSSGVKCTWVTCIENANAIISADTFDVILVEEFRKISGFNTLVGYTSN